MSASPTPSTRSSLPQGQVVLRGLANLDVTARVEEFGEGKPVTFLHGLVGLNDHWEGTVRKVRERHRCVLLQLPLLDLEDDDCSINGATVLTARFLEQHVQEPSILVGNSFGGHVALRIALERPDLVRGLVLAGSSGLIEKSMVREVQIRPTRGWLEQKIGELFFDRAKMNPEDVDRAHKELSQRGHARAMIRLSRSARRNHLGEKIGQITTPTLLIWGRQDVVTPPEAAEGFKSRIRDSRIVWFDQCGHAPMIECPDLFADALLAFGAELEARESPE